MAQRGSQVLILSRANSSTNLSYQPDQNLFTAFNNPFSSHFTPHKNAYISPMTKSQRSQSKRLSLADVGRITGSSFREGQPVKGENRISYVPYEKKIIDYQTRTYTEMRPKTKRVIDYQEKRIVQNVPRQVVRQQYYPVQKITKVCKQIVEVRPVEKKVKKLQYVPVEKYIYVKKRRKIVHYPENQDYKMVQSPSKLHIRNHVILNQHHSKLQPIESQLRYEYTGTPSKVSFNYGGQNAVSRKLVYSKSPSYVNQSLSSSKVEVFKVNPSTSRLHINSSRHVLQPEETQEKNEKEEIRPASNLSRSKLLERYASTGKLSAANYL